MAVDGTVHRAVGSTGDGTLDDGAAGTVDDGAGGTPDDGVAGIVDDIEAARRDTEDRLVERYGRDPEAAEHVRRAVADAYDRLGDARVTTFLPVLIERSVRRTLDA